jgi:HD-GYP domain-containing protein (c-di-GMP phosphodiesterase class II)
MGEDELITLSVCALFHDSALTEWVTTGESSGVHCSMGQYNVGMLPLPTDASGIVLYHHERPDGSGVFGSKDFPLAAEIISLADSYDAGVPLDGFSSGLLAVLGQQDSDAALPQWHLEGQEAVKLGLIIARAIDYKSKFTRRHTLGISEKARHMAGFYGYGEEETAKLYLAACLHDLGKLATPTEVLEKPGRLTDAEFETIKGHVLKTYDMLEGVDPDIRHWAAGHHEKLDGTGYPFGLKEEGLDFNAKLMACIDIYQAVSEERPYHPARSHEDTMKILYQMAENGMISKSVSKDLGLALG